MVNNYTLLRLGGRQPLCGNGVTSMILSPLYLPMNSTNSRLTSITGSFNIAFTLRNPKSYAIFAQSCCHLSGIGVFFFNAKAHLSADDHEIT